MFFFVFLTKFMKVGAKCSFFGNFDKEGSFANYFSNTWCFESKEKLLYWLWSYVTSSTVFPLFDLVFWQKCWRFMAKCSFFGNFEKVGSFANNFYSSKCFESRKVWLDGYYLPPCHSVIQFALFSSLFRVGHNFDLYLKNAIFLLSWRNCCAR